MCRGGSTFGRTKATTTAAFLFTVTAGCASELPQSPQLRANERMQEQYLWGSESIPKEETILYGIKSSKCNSAVSRPPEHLYKIFVTDKATYIVSRTDAPKILASWNYTNSPIQALPVKRNNSSCIQISEKSGDGSMKIHGTYSSSGYTKSVSKLINYLVEQAQNRPE